MIEQRNQRLDPGDASALPAWRFGDPSIDRWIGGGLDPAALHEIKPAGPRPDLSAAAAWASARAFALTLARRRLASGGSARASILWVSGGAGASEYGIPYAPGLPGLGIAAEDVLVALPRTAADVLWTLEEGLKAGSLALVVGELAEVALTPARRLALAAQAHATPCLLLTHPRTAAMAAAATRWRVAPAPSRPLTADARAAGRATFALQLERCRTHPATAGIADMHVEWLDEAYRFGLVPGLRHRSAAPRGAYRRAG